MYLGNLSFVASFSASLQASEIVKLLINRGEVLENKILMLIIR